MKRHSKSLIALIEKYCPNPYGGVEVGVSEGQNSAHLLETFANLKLIMVDRYSQYTQEEGKSDPRQARKSQAEMYELCCNALKLTEFAAERRIMMICDSVFASRTIKEGSLDFVFIDAHHLYESVKRDISYWRPKVRSGGLLCGHDYDGRGDRKGWFGVKRAVDEEFGSRVETMPGLIWYVII